MKIQLNILKANKRISVVSILSFFLFAELITIDYFSSSFYTVLQYFFLLLILFFCLKNFNLILKANIVVITIFLCSLLLGVGIVGSSYINHVATYNFRDAIYYAFLIFVISFYLIIVAKKKQLKSLLNAGKIYLIIILVANDFLMFAFPEQFYNIHGRDIGTCLIGNKFVVAYAHMALLFILMIFNKKREKIKIIIYGLIAIVICLYVDCMTSVLGTVILLILYFVPKRVKYLLLSPIVFSASFFLSACLLILFQSILNFGPIRFIIVDILHRDLTLTGRMEIYNYILNLISFHPMFGYGHGTNVVEEKSIWYANAQNAFWDFTINYGFVTSLLLFLYLLAIMFIANKTKIKVDFSTGMYVSACMLYVYMFIGIGEIVYNRMFIFYATLLAAFCIEVVYINNRKIENHDF